MSFFFFTSGLEIFVRLDSQAYFKSSLCFGEPSTIRGGSASASVIQYYLVLGGWCVLVADSPR